MEDEGKLLCIGSNLFETLAYQHSLPTLDITELIISAETSFLCALDSEFIGEMRERKEGVSPSFNHFPMFMDF